MFFFQVMREVSSAFFQCEISNAPQHWTHPGERATTKISAQRHPYQIQPPYEEILDHLGGSTMLLGECSGNLATQTSQYILVVCFNYNCFSKYLILNKKFINFKIYLFSTHLLQHLLEFIFMLIQPKIWAEFCQFIKTIQNILWLQLQEANKDHFKMFSFITLISQISRITKN